jgi:hypothetical protein
LVGNPTDEKLRTSQDSGASSQHLTPEWGALMPIRPFLDGHKFDPETIRIMGLAFEMAREALRLADRTDLPTKPSLKR